MPWRWSTTLYRNVDTILLTTWIHISCHNKRQFKLTAVRTLNLTNLVSCKGTTLKLDTQNLCCQTELHANAVKFMLPRPVSVSQYSRKAGDTILTSRELMSRVLMSRELMSRDLVSREFTSRNVCNNRYVRGVLAREITRRKQSDRSVNLRHRIQW